MKPIFPRFLSVAFLCTLGQLNVAQATLDFSNAGFEDNLTGWYASPEDKSLGLSQPLPEAAHSGEIGLRVTQQGTAGSWLQSPRVTIQPNQDYRLSFWARILDTSGIGVWVQFYGDDGRVIKPAGGDLSLQLPPKPSDWSKHTLDFHPPTGATAMTVAVHGYSKHKVKADFDDFSITPVDPSAKPKLHHALIPDPARVDAIAASLPAIPDGVAPSIDDRALWETLKSDDPQLAKRIMTQAERFYLQPPPELSLEAYQASVKSGDRQIDNVTSHRRYRLVILVLAEAMENQGRFLPAINSEIKAICSEPSWILSAHVPFSGDRNDLGTAMTAWNLATVYDILGNRLNPQTRELIKKEVKSRALSKYLATVRGEAKPEWWSLDPNNWNAVVHGGLVGSAIVFLDDPHERAEVIAGAELGVKRYINSFPPDGYSLEGMGYWKYGFGHYILLAETAYQSTNGLVDLYTPENCRLIILFPYRFEMDQGLFPAYGDAMLTEPSSGWLNHIIDKRFGLEAGTERVWAPDPTYSAFLYSYGVNLAFDDNEPPLIKADSSMLNGHRLHDWFDLSQIYVGRLPEGVDGLSFSFKGGHNGVSHGHNDIGSFVVELGGVPVLVDPGVPVYNAASMGPNAYQHHVKASYGHPVPLVAGQWQKHGSEYKAMVLETDFDEAGDHIVLDIAQAYSLPVVKSLIRSFDFDRTGAGKITVTDTVDFDSPQSFGTALLTYGEAKEISPDVWEVSNKGQTVRVHIESSAAYTVTNGWLKDESREGKVRRLGIDLNEPATAATISLKITPVTH
ncbi:carbohydrate binding domain-containing protein [Cerasicoccus arenae]|uniref:Heparinase II/III-like protein n=1 Tax=Cerasicoccus arenae TaxID=424488 RepID=A0A8J3DCK0_9BACT|nr:heparinase II/III family protein [Cerasicoccus arenae]MBK1859609.1 heparinase II/III family protein [Cerasicoccus arenae]GHC03607.1 hypothetical protein GCM10007047_20270 [Cerasicoccus arenae]